MQDIIDNKSTLDKLFFGETNSYVEFLFETPFDGIYGLRIIPGDSERSYTLEAMYLSEPDCREANRILSRYENPILIPYELQDSIPTKVKTLINEYNKNRPRILAEKNVYEPYRPKVMSVNISG